MVVFPNAKINLGLHITEKREDGYHNIESIFVPIPINDVLEITQNNSNKTIFTSTGIAIPSDGKPNLVERAWMILKGENNIPTCDLDLLKNIPIGAGLGGGSADAAACMIGLNNLFNLNIPEDRLLSLASQLGADCAFFVKNKPVYAEGIGDQFSGIELDLSGYHFVIIYPDIHVSTPEAYKHVVPTFAKKDIRDILNQPIETWKNELKNDFESSVFKQYPKIREVKERLYQAGSNYASMSGSGSTLFGIFKEECTESFDGLGQVWKFTL